MELSEQGLDAAVRYVLATQNDGNCFIKEFGVRHIIEAYERGKLQPKRWETAELSDIVPGRNVYYVHALGSRSFMTEYMVLKQPRFGTGACADSKFVDVWNPNAKYVSEFSLIDCNVIPNKYNEHKLFLDSYKAKEYLNYCK